MPEAIKEEAPAEVAAAPEKKDEAVVAAEAPKVVVKIPQPEKKQVVKPVRKQRQLDANDPESVKAFIARKNSEHIEILENAGYKPVAVSAIINTFMNQEKGYEKSHGRDHLVLMLENFGEHLLYKTERFTIDESAVLDSLLIASYADLMEVENIFEMPAEDAKSLVNDILNKVWKRKERVIGANKEMFMQIKQYLFAALNPKYAEGYAQRARYLLECINFIRTQQIEIWAGMFHDKPVRNPQFEQRERRKQLKERPKGDPCPICGKPMLYSFAAQKWFCPDSTCENWLPPPEKKPFKRGNKPEKVQKAHGPGYDSGKPIEQKSGVDKFRAKYGGAKPGAKKPKEAAPAQKPPEAPAGLGTDWSALDKLQVQHDGEPAKKEDLPPPPDSSAGEPPVQTTTTSSPETAPAAEVTAQHPDQASTTTGEGGGNPA